MTYSNTDPLAAMVRRLPPAGAPVVPRSTPVVAFGDPRTATVATLGINPSKLEFIEHSQLLSGADRRLATLDSLGAQDLDQLTDEQVTAVIADCTAYFRRRPYRRWFDPLDSLLQASTGSSYYDGTACHLDLVQWATDPTWASIGTLHVRRDLLDDGVPHLRAILAQSTLRVILLNGRQVLNQVTAAGLTSLTEVATVPRPRDTCRIYTGDSGGLRWIGWSTNLQSSRGVSSAFTHQLTDRITTMLNPTTDYLPKGQRVQGKRELIRLLSAWLDSSQADTIGDVRTYKQSAWLYADIDGHRVRINADTTRAAVEAVVRLNTDVDRPWQVVANQRGTVNKILPYQQPEPLPGWYAYLTTPLPQCNTI